MIEEKLKELEISLPEPVKPVGFYVPALRVNNLLFLSGILPFREGKISKKGKVPLELSIEEASEEAKQTVLNALAIVREHAGSLDKIKQCIKITGYIAASDDFVDHPKVLNPASEMLFKIFGDRGKHCRVAVGVSSLPLGAVVEMDFIFELV
ncbi:MULTISPECIES: RidA family protein [Thermodesulfovibrio]|jgi:enamine deaminase RidA (YjgF/YER057c/UK114 family)|uniref:RidA family protein n=1 Tax=Thermodesulfovibrio TaxID=28261 RepID=UPI00261AEB7D|nr:RidA family protein [Thermodesulfovibrio sp.]